MEMNDKLRRDLISFMYVRYLINPVFVHKFSYGPQPLACFDL